MNDYIESFQKEFSRILEIRSREIVDVLADGNKSDEQKFQRIQGRLIYDTGHLQRLTENITKKLKETNLSKAERDTLENLIYRINENYYLDKN